MEDTENTTHVDRVGKCQICGGLIEHYAGDPKDQWRHVEVRNHAPQRPAEPKEVQS